MDRSERRPVSGNILLLFMNRARPGHVGRGHRPTEAGTGSAQRKGRRHDGRDREIRHADGPGLGADHPSVPGTGTDRPGTAHRAVRGRVRPRARRGPRARGLARVRPDGPAQDSQGPRPPGRLRDHRAGADLLGGPGDDQGRGPEAGVRRHRPGDVHAEPRSRGARDHPEHPRGAAHASLRPRVRHGSHPGAGAPARPEGDRGLRALARLHLQGADGGHARRRQLLQLPGVQAAEHVRRRPGLAARRRGGAAGGGVCRRRALCRPRSAWRRC